MNSTKTLVSVIVLLAGLLYVLSVLWAGIASITGDSFQPLFLQIIVVIGGILSTNLGAVLGITFTPPSPGLKSLSKPKFLKLKSSFEPTKGSQLTNTVDNNQKLQIIACWVYVLSLAMALLFLLATYFLDSKYPADLNQNPVEVLLNLTQTLLGVMGGVLAVRLGSNNQI